MQGTCNCGQIKFEILGPIPKFYQCHCSLCRKQGGTSSNTATIVTADQFRWLTGQEHISSWTKDTGFRSDFCSRCGSPVPNPVSGSPYYWIPAGLLEDGPFEIVAHLFVDSKAAWDMMGAYGRRYETMPALDELMALLGA